MKRNMGNADKAIRVLVAVVIGLLYYTNVISGTVAIVLLVLGSIFVLTSILGFCPIYSLFGFNTCPAKKAG